MLTLGVKTIRHAPNKFAISLSSSVFDFFSCSIFISERYVRSDRTSKQDWVLRDDANYLTPRCGRKFSNICEIINENRLDFLLRKKSNLFHHKLFCQGSGHSTVAEGSEQTIFRCHLHHCTKRWASVILNKQNGNSYTITTLSPTPNSRSKSFRISTPFRLGYSKCTCSNFTMPSWSLGTSSPTPKGTAGERSSTSKIRIPAPIPRIIED